MLHLQDPLLRVWPFLHQGLSLEDAPFSLVCSIAIGLALGNVGFSASASFAMSDQC